MADRELMRQVEAVGRWEDEHRALDGDRLTKWFSDWNIHTVLIGVEADQIRQRYMEITREV